MPSSTSSRRTLYWPPACSCLTMELQMISRTCAGMGKQAIFERSAIQQQGMVLLPGAGNELVHDAAARADKGILRALAGEGDGWRAAA